MTEELKNRIIAIPDVHGDYDALVVCLVDLARVCRLEPSEACEDKKCLNDRFCRSCDKVWTGGSTTVLVLGDILDRIRPSMSVVSADGRTPGEQKYDELNCIRMLNRLHEQAIKQGGKVIKILGNHEVMNFYGGDYRYVTRFARENDVHRCRSHEREPENSLYQQEYMKHGAKVIEKIGKYVFCHGGVVPETVKDLNPKNLSDFVDTANKMVTKMFTTSESFDAREKEVFRQLILNDKTSIVWNRFFGYDDGNKDTCKMLEKTWTKLNTSLDTTLIVAHCPQFNSSNIDIEIKQVVDMERSDERRMVIGGPPKEISTMLQRNTDKSASKRWTNDLEKVVVNEQNPDPLYGMYPSMNSKCQGRVWRLDVAMSRAFDTKHKKFQSFSVYQARLPSVLEIVDPNTTRDKVNVIRATFKSWPTRRY